LADRIAKKELTENERQKFLKEERKGCLSESKWLQEYLCSPQDETKAMLPYTLIQSCERDNILMPVKNLTGELYLGYDVARRVHLSIIYIIEKVGNSFIVRYLRALKNTDWTKQEEILYELLENPNIHRACLDQTGLGDQFTERAQNKFGKGRVEGVWFTNAVKSDIAISLEKAFQDTGVLIPKDDQQRESLHSVRKITTSAGNTRYDAATSEIGHGDYFWGLGLALHATNKITGKMEVTSGNPGPESESMEAVLKDY